MMVLGHSSVSFRALSRLAISPPQVAVLIISKPVSGPSRAFIYSLNPADDAQIGTILGCFQNSEVPGKIQHGSAWWFNDHKIGMEEQMTRLASLGLLGNFVGMLTDSRSFLSYTRHDYFRRILCNIIGQWVEDGEYPNDEKALEKIVKGICFDNAKRYFNL